MKIKGFMVATILAMVLLASSCSVFMVAGEPGKVYVALQADSSVSTSSGSSYTVKYDAYVNFPDLPSTIYMDTPYIQKEGKHTGAYVAYFYDGYYSYYTYDGDIYYVTGKLTDYTQLDTIATTITYTLSANPGEDGFLVAGNDGADKTYDIYLAWDTSKASVTARDLGHPMVQKSMRTEGRVITKEFTDGFNTVTLTITPPSHQLAGSRLLSEKQ